MSDGGWTKFPTDPDDPHLYPVVDYNGQQCFRVPKTMETTPFYLLEMEWGQDAPYNLECYTKEGARAKAGCVAVALGQIMAYHKQPQSYNGHTYYWDSMPKKASEYDSSEEARSVSYLINDIGKAVFMDYGVDASGAFDKDCPAALEQFGYTYSSYSDYATYKVTESLENNMPVYMRGTDTRRGKGHAWVADGYYEIVSTVTYYLVSDLSIVHTDELSRTTYLHINWGWDGYDDAYYLAYAFKPNNIQYYSADLQMITGIRYDD